MNKITPLLFSVVLGSVAPTFGATEGPASAVLDSESRLEEIQKTREEKIAAVEALVTQAAGDKSIKPLTESSYLDLLRKFRSPDETLVEAERLYQQWQGESGEKLEPVNAAVLELRREVLRLRDEEKRVLSGMTVASVEALSVVGSNTLKPGDLSEAAKLNRLTRKYIDRRGTRGAGSNGTGYVLDSLFGVIDLIRRVLEAKEANDGELMLTLLTTNTVSAVMVPPEQGLGVTIPKPDAIWSGFRSRMVPFCQAYLTEHQRKLEKLIIEKASSEAIDAALLSFDRAASQMDRLVVDATRPVPSGISGNTEASKRAGLFYRSIADALTLMRTNPEGVGIKLEPVPGPGQYSPGGEFRAFVMKIAAELDERQKANLEKSEIAKRLAREKMEEVRRNESFESERRKQAQQAEVAAAEQRKTLEYLEKARGVVRERLLNVQSSKDALLLADEIPRLVAINEDSGSRRDTALWRQMEPVQGFLRRLASSWLEANSDFGMMHRGESSSVGFVEEFDLLIDRAKRDSLSRRLKLPELKRPPFSEQTVSAALESLANEASDRGEWKRALELLSAGYQQDLRQSARTQAIHFYLTGMNYEQAEQFAEAIEAYQAVLQQVDERIPIKEASARLKALKKSHPDAFDRGATRRRDAR